MTAPFPKDFIWGTATAAHQVEGGNANCDLWPIEMAKGSPFAEPSGDACDQYHRYREDIALLAALGFKAYRFSVEWARIEPEEGFFSRAVLDHYRRVAACCLEHGVKPIVTFHHFTNPMWFSKDGGWEDKRSVDLFARYAERAGRALGDLIHAACTINEANIPMMFAVSRGAVSDYLRSAKITEILRKIAVEPERFGSFMFSNPKLTTSNLIAAHRKAYDALKGLGHGFPVGVTLALNDYQAAPGGEAKLKEVHHLANGQFLEAARGDDFIGVQTYTRVLVGPEGTLPPPQGAKLTQLDQEIYPPALEGTIRDAAKITGSPVLVTENGIGTEDDAERIAYTRGALQGVLRCLEGGIDVRGYLHWSLLDNFEWILGYRPKFGLVAVDRETQMRTPKPSAHWLGAVARANALG